MSCRRDVCWSIVSKNATNSACVCRGWVQATVKCKADLRGLLGMSGAVPDLEAIEIDMQIASPDGAEKVQALHRAWLERCPVYLALTKPPSVKTTVSRTA